MLAKFEVRIAISFLPLLAFNAQKFKVSRDPGHAPFSKKSFGIGIHVGTPHWSTRAKYAVRIFNPFGAIST